MTVSYTANFRWGVPDFLSGPWHNEWDQLVRDIDRTVYQAIVAGNVAPWANSTVYAIGQLVIDTVGNGIMYTAATAHTSPASPTTFAQDRTANPGRWNATANIPQQRGIWATGATYIQGDFVLNADRYAVCLVGHVAGADFDVDVAAGKWVVLIDFSLVGVGINAQPEGSIASALLMNIGAEAPTRLLVTGNTSIESLGIVTNTFKLLRFEQVLTLVHDAVSLIIPGGNDRITDPGGVGLYSSDSVGNWREIFYTRGDGAPLNIPTASTTVTGIVELATTAETQALTDPARVVTPSGLGFVVTDVTTSILNTIRGGVGPTLDTFAEVAVAISLLAPKASPVFTGHTVFDGANQGGLTNPAGNLGNAEMRANAGSQPFIGFHIVGQFGQYLGMDNTGRMATGGWSRGAAFGYIHDEWGTGKAVQAEMEAQSAVNRYISPDILRYHPGVPKAWGRVAGAALQAGSHNVTSVSNSGGANVCTVNLSIALNNICPVLSGNSGNSADNFVCNIVSSSSFSARAFNAVTGPTNANDFTFVVFGDL